MLGDLDEIKSETEPLDSNRSSPDGRQLSPKMNRSKSSDKASRGSQDTKPLDISEPAVIQFPEESKIGDSQNEAQIVIDDDASPNTKAEQKKKLDN